MSACVEKIWDQKYIRNSMKKLFEPPGLIELFESFEMFEMCKKINSNSFLCVTGLRP